MTAASTSDARKRNAAQVEVVAGPQMAPIPSSPLDDLIEENEVLRARFRAVDAFICGSHPLPYCRRDGEIVVGIINGVKAALGATS